jgi:hypothetical protein
MRRYVLGGLMVLALSNLTAAAHATAGTNPELLPLNLPMIATHPAVPVANWTFLGCWSRGGGSPCVDVYRDSQGDLWLCKACGTTGNPSPGKCTRTSQAVLDRGLWCS